MKKSDTPFLDRVFLHSKNADERLFDMILRIITFIVLIIILWLYADIAHAKADSTNYLDEYLLGSNRYGLKPYLNDGDWNMLDDILSDIPRYTGNYNFTNEVPGHITITSDMNLNNYYIIGRTHWSSPGDSGFIIQIDPQVAISNHVMIIGENVIHSDSVIQTTNIWYNKRDSTNSSQYVVHNITIPAGNNAINSIVNYSADCYVFMTNVPMLFGSAIDTQGFIENGNTDTCFNANYMSYDNILINDISETPVESDINHMYLKDYSIGLTSADFLLDSNLIISAKWDNWVERYISHYKMVIVYQVDYNGEPWSRTDVSPPVEQPMHWMVTDTVPLGKFSSYYSIGIRDIFSRMGVNEQSAIAICNALQNSGAIIATSNGSTTIQDVLNGLTAEFKVSTTGVGASGGVNLGVLYAYLREQLDSLHAGETTVFIDDFRLTVNFHLVSDRLSVGDTSGLGGAEFDFLNGTTDYSYDILNNNNEWSEPNTPNLNNETASSSSSGGDITNSNVAYGGNASSNVGDINITTGNGYKDTELHQLTNQDIVNNHLKIITVIEDLKYCFHQFAQQNNHNSFMQMIIDDYGQIPGVEYIATSIIILCGVCILIFIIKIAF